MTQNGWLYIAPQRIRAGKLALPKCEKWEDFENLNLQRLARVFEFHGCIAFVGSGASADLGYPPWPELLPREKYESHKVKVGATKLQWGDVLAEAKLFKNLEERKRKIDELKRISEQIGEIDATQAIQIAEETIGDGGRRAIVGHYLRSRFFEDSGGKKRYQNLRKTGNESPFPNLLKLPIRRFITTNYDKEIEKQLAEKLGTMVWKPELSFQQTDQDKMAIFAVALASGNRNMVFHCHGLLSEELKRLEAPDSGKSRSALVLTDSDYNHWYLSRDPKAYTFQRVMDVVLQSNPLFFVGYSISDFDLLRILRQASLRWESERLASNLFLFLRKDENKSPADLWKQAKQIKLGVNLFLFDGKKSNLSQALGKLSLDCSEARREWLIQPRVRPRGEGPMGFIQSRPSINGGTEKDPLFAGVGPIVKKIASAFKTKSVVALLGGAGSAKFLKACQYVQSEFEEDTYDKVDVFHSYNNDDIYSYFKRISGHLVPPKAGSKPTLVVINNIDLLLGDEPSERWVAPNKGARLFLETLWAIAEDSAGSNGGKQAYSGLKVLVTARSLEYPDHRKGAANPAFGQEIEKIHLDDELKQKTPSQLMEEEGIDLSFTFGELLSCPRQEAKNICRRLRWELQHDNFGLVLATRYVEGGLNKNEREMRLKRLLETLQANSSEMGTRVVRHIVRDMDGGKGREHETLLWFLSFFNTPFELGVFEAVFDCARTYQSIKARATGSNSSEAFLRRLLRSGFVQEIEQRLEPPNSSERHYIVPPLVKRYFREIMEKTPNDRETREFGLHGLLSKGPFNSPGCSKKPKTLFDYLIELAYEKLSKTKLETGSTGSDEDRDTAICLRAIVDLIRSNFSCNSVPLWGEFRDYIDMLSITIDLLRNFARLKGDTWKPSAERVAKFADGVATDIASEMQANMPTDSKSGEWVGKNRNHAVASADEMLHLYNELGLAYYQIGSVQDALRVWGLATDWRKVVSSENHEQGEMYSATLNAHLGAAYMQLGRMQTARECFGRALASARKNEDPDLEYRMKGMLARVDHFGGCVEEALTTYREVIKRLGELKNRRAQCYFMRHLAALESRFGDKEEAARLANSSMAIAASENAPDQAAFSLELRGRVDRAKGQDREAMRHYGIALIEAEKLDIARLKIDIFLGTAEIQLKVGDTGAARASALDALKKANEHLLVLRQAKALIILGKVAQARSEIGLATSLLGHAKKLAAESMFRLTEHDAKEALAALRAS